jgi:hypothetical protein
MKSILKIILDIKMMMVTVSNQAIYQLTVYQEEDGSIPKMSVAQSSKSQKEQYNQHVIKV